MAKLNHRKIQRYGWKPDLPDHRDYKSTLRLTQVELPSVVDLSTDPHMPLVWDQGQLGSCTAHSVGAAWAYASRKAKKARFKPSRLWIYYQERVIEGTVNEDSGAEIRDGFKVLAKIGVPPEEDWKYVISKFANAPSAKTISDSVHHHAIVYSSVNQEELAIKSVLASGFPVSFGFTVFESFESEEVAQTGVVPFPSPDEDIMGGHAVLIVGYSDRDRTFLVRNSWGPEWGQKGYFTMPYDYVLNPELASDFWYTTVAN
jgi:C1A family cysteine protease